MRQGVWCGAVLLMVLAGQVAVAQSTPAAADPQKQQTPATTAGQSQSTPAGQAPAEGQQSPTAAPPSAPAPSAAQQFPFPEDDSKTKEIPELHTAPAPVPNGPTPNAPQGNGGKFPFPGSEGSQAAGGGFSSSSDVAPANPAPGAEPDVPVRKKLELTDVGSSGRVDTARAEEDQRVADFYIKDGNYAGAYLRYKDAVVFSPDDPDAHFGLAEMARRQGKKPEAIAEYNACVKADPQGKHAKEARRALAELQRESTGATTGKP